MIKVYLLFGDKPEGQQKILGIFSNIELLEYHIKSCQIDGYIDVEYKIFTIDKPTCFSV